VAADKTHPTILTFKIKKVDAGEYLIRLRVDGIDSLPVVLKGSQLEFDANQKLTVQ